MPESQSYEIHAMVAKNIYRVPGGAKIAENGAALFNLLQNRDIYPADELPFRQQ
jgi:hypothetical protein